MRPLDLQLDDGAESAGRGSNPSSSSGSSFDQAASDSDFIDRAIDEPCTYEVEGIGGRAIKH